ncbi:DUF1376 domain-containing protein [Bartonella sp. ML70XJBT.G]|uniref:DUF1376 domain-containing protein n=1 Tax=Bartonella sp. ML70XJBT.G TaxID=3019093 RepID=UPI002360D222|nr:DUF1376 domain-containing protein [Bartonella sp. ML70XJBT.G]
MSSKIPWTRLFADKWLLDLAHLPSFEGFIYVKLRFQMLRTGEPLTKNFRVLSLLAGCSVKRFQKALDLLLETKHIILSEDGRLWSLDVEEELNNCNENLEKVSKAYQSKRLSERAQKAAKARWEKHKNGACDDAKDPENPEKYTKNYANVVKHGANGMLKDTKHDAYDMLNNASIYNINNNTNNYNIKNKTIVLSKKEIDFEDLETNDLVDEPTEVADVESPSEQIETIATKQPPIHEQENVSKKPKRSKAHRGSRLPDDFEPDYDFALAEGLPPERIKVEMAKFRDYWRSKAGANATKIDWQATWRNWVRNSKDHKINQQGGNYGNCTQKQKSIGERIADSIMDIGNRGYFEAYSRNDTPERSICFEGWQPINTTAGRDSLRCF